MSRILHFGPGNFFRAHLADYTSDAGAWNITAVSLRSSSFRDEYQPDVGYTLAVQGQSPKRIKVIDEVLVAPETPDRVLERIADPEVTIISATVTEKGYCLGADGRLDLSLPEVARDLDGGTPATLIGYVARGLARRNAPVTLLSCDNRLGNGDALAQVLKDFAHEAGLVIGCDYTVPNSMVDRITPATTDALRAATDDALAVLCEPFKEWVLEDRFAGSHPDWPGVQWTEDVAPHEMRKLRMLNGAHSYLAYAGAMAGHEFVHQAIADPALRDCAETLMAEAAETLPSAMQKLAPTYANALIERFENPHLAHSLRQIAMDGSQKLPYRIVDTLKARNLAKSPALLSCLSAWITFCRAETAAGRALQDPAAERLAIADKTEDFLSVIGAEAFTSALSE